MDIYIACDSNVTFYRLYRYKLRQSIKDTFETILQHINQLSLCWWVNKLGDVWSPPSHLLHHLSGSSLPCHCPLLTGMWTYSCTSSWEPSVGGLYTLAAYAVTKSVQSRGVSEDRALTHRRLMEARVMVQGRETGVWTKSTFFHKEITLGSDTSFCLAMLIPEPAILLILEQTLFFICWSRVSHSLCAFVHAELWGGERCLENEWPIIEMRTVVLQNASQAHSSPRVYLTFLRKQEWILGRRGKGFEKKSKSKKNLPTPL